MKMLFFLFPLFFKLSALAGSEDYSGRAFAAEAVQNQSLKVIPKQQAHASSATAKCRQIEELSGTDQQRVYQQTDLRENFASVSELISFCHQLTTGRLPTGRYHYPANSVDAVNGSGNSTGYGCNTNTDCGQNAVCSHVGASGGECLQNPAGGKGTAPGVECGQDTDCVSRYCGSNNICG